MSEDNTTSSPPPAPALVFDRMEGFTSLYANNVIFEGNAWDLKMKFGQVELIEGQTHIKLNAEISIPWAQAKLLIYWLRLQVESMEIQSGKIAIRRDILPPEPPALSPEDVENPDSVKMHEFAIKAHAEFLASL
jgi:uncharacterized protein DUF3467